MTKGDWNSQDADYFRLFPTRFLKGVRGLGQNEFKVYTLLLLRMYEEDGPLRRNDAKLATFCEMREPAFTKALDRLILIEKIDVLDDGRLFNATARNEIEWRNSRRAAGRKAGLESVARRAAEKAERRDGETDFGEAKTSSEKTVEKQRATSTIVAETLNQEEKRKRNTRRRKKIPPMAPARGAGRSRSPLVETSSRLSSRPSGSTTPGRSARVMRSAHGCGLGARRASRRSRIPSASSSAPSAARSSIRSPISRRG
jgi:uncharacterized protein YdaU (DUF1376 family)